MRHLLVGLFAVSLIANTLADDLSPAAKKELERLAGDWKIVSITRDGKAEEPPEALRQLRVDGDKMLVGEKRDQDIGLRITQISAETKPQIIDVTHPETKKTLEGIYELTDEQWKMCLNAEGTAERPGAFDGGTAKFILVILERVK